jgi:hypothetical protein
MFLRFIPGIEHLPDLQGLVEMVGDIETSGSKVLAVGVQELSRYV